MGAVLGLFFGTGVLLVWQSLASPRPVDRRSPRVVESADALLARAGIDNVTGVGLLSLSGLFAVTALVAMMVVSQTAPIALAFAGMAAWAPIAIVRSRATRRQRELVEVWPEAVDNLASAVRAGLSLPEALSHLRVTLWGYEGYSEASGDLLPHQPGQNRGRPGGRTPAQRV